MIQELGDKVYHCEYENRKPNWQTDYLLAYRGDKVLLRNGEIPMLKDVKEWLHEKPLQYLISVSDTGFFMPKSDIPAPEGYSYERMQVFRTMQPQWLAFAGVTGHHLYSWYQGNRFCGACGKEMVHKQDERAMQCPCCGRVVYPNISVATIVAIVNGDKLLVSKYAGRGNAPSYALIAGYTEIGETLEQCVHREVMEETGLRVKNLKYFTSQPWGFSNSVLAGFFAELDGSDEIHVDTNELAEAKWITKEDLSENPNGASMTSWMMECFRTGNYPK